MITLFILGLASFGWLMVNAEPVILFKRLLGFKEENYDKFGELKSFLHRLIYCEVCLTYWITFLICLFYQYTLLEMIIIPSITSVVAGIIKVIMGR
jgi:hypothetical protein